MGSFPDIAVRRLAHLRGGNELTGVFGEKCAPAFLVSLSEGRDETLDSLPERINRTWNFDVRGNRVWVALDRKADRAGNRGGGGNRPASAERVFENSAERRVGVSLGYWRDQQTYVARHVIGENNDGGVGEWQVASVCFRKKEGLVVRFRFHRRGDSDDDEEIDDKDSDSDEEDSDEEIEELFGGRIDEELFGGRRELAFSQTELREFGLVDWGRDTSDPIRLFLPFKSPPTAGVFYTVNGEEKYKRLFDKATFPVLEHTVGAQVLCITLLGSTRAEQVAELQTDFLAVSLFTSRVDVLDETHLPPMCEFQLRQCNLQTQLLPTLNAEQGVSRDVHWLLLTVFSQRLGCLTPTVKEQIFDYCVTVLSFVLGELNPVLGLPDESPRLIHALHQCLGVPYWDDLERRFFAAANAFGRVAFSGDARVDTLRRAAYEGIGACQRPRSSRRDAFNQFKVYRAVLTPSGRTIYLPPATAKVGRKHRSKFVFVNVYYTSTTHKNVVVKFVQFFDASRSITTRTSSKKKPITPSTGIPTIPNVRQ